MFEGEQKYEALSKASLTVYQLWTRSMMPTSSGLPPMEPLELTANYTWETGKQSERQASRKG